MESECLRQTCRHATAVINGSVIFQVWNRTENSAWVALISSIKKRGNRMNFYANFQLTHRRSGLLYALRRYTKEGKICKFYTTENGAIAFKTSGDQNKTFISYFRKGSGILEKTLTLKELDAMV